MVIGDCSLVLTLWSREVLAFTSYKIRTAAVIENKTLHLHLSNLAVMLAIVWITGSSHNFGLLNQELVRAHLVESTAAIRDHRVPKLHQTMTHTAHKAIHVDETVSEVRTRLFKQN